MAAVFKREIRHTNSVIKAKTKMGGRVVVSRAIVKEDATNLIPHLHVKRGDTVMVISGSEKFGRGKTGKVLNVFPKKGKVIVEGINIITKATKQRTPMGQSGLIKKEAPIFASKVMLFCLSCKKPTRIKHKMLDNNKKTRICKHCSEAFDA